MNIVHIFVQIIVLIPFEVSITFIIVQLLFEIFYNLFIVYAGLYRQIKHLESF